MAQLSFALPKYEDAINNLYDEVYYGFHMLDDILSLFPPRHVMHSGITRQVSSPNILETAPKPYTSSFSIGIDVFLQTDVTGFSDHLFHLVTSLQIQQKIDTFNIMSLTSDATENTVEGKGRNFWDVYIELLQKAEMGFDENGNPDYQFSLNSNTARKAEATPLTEEHVKRMKEVMDAKREEFFANKRSRRLS